MEERPGLGKTWTVIGIAIAFVVLFVAILFVRQTYLYYRGIQQGKDVNPSRISRTQKLHPSVIAEIDQLKILVAGTSDVPYSGPASATHEVVEFLDFECPNSSAIEPQVRTLVNSRPDVKIIYRDYPILDLHPDALESAKAARCIWRLGDERLYWRFRETLFANQGKQDADGLRSYAGMLGANLAKYDACLRDPSVEREIDASISVGEQAGIEGTPTFFIDGMKVEGALPVELIDREP